MWRKYDPLGEYLAELGHDRLTLTFEKIQEIIDRPLPASALSSRTFWGNDFSHSQARAWLLAGYKASHPSLDQQRVSFVRMSAHEFEYMREMEMFGVASSLGPGPRRGWVQASIDFDRRVKAGPPPDWGDEEAFETMLEGLRFLPRGEVIVTPQVYGPPVRGRRTRPGYGEIFVGFPERGPILAVLLRFIQGRIHVVVFPAEPMLRKDSMWPSLRLLQGWQYILLWQKTTRLLVVWPKGRERHKRLPFDLHGIFSLPAWATPRDYLRAFRWLCREASAYSDGLHKVLHRKRGISPVRAVELADKRLNRHVRPRIQIHTVRAAGEAIDSMYLWGSDEPSWVKRLPSERRKAG